MAIYSTTLQNNDSQWFTWTYTAGTVTLNITYYWPTPIQEQFNRINTFFKRFAAANPFIEESTGNIVRDYDVRDVIANGWTGYRPYNDQGMDEWRLNAAYTVGDLYDQYEYMEEMLVWNLSINDGKDMYTSALRSGGSLSADDSSWTLTFISSKDGNIARDELDLVTMYIEVPD